MILFCVNRFNYGDAAKIAPLAIAAPSPAQLATAQPLSSNAAAEKARPLALSALAATHEEDFSQPQTPRTRDARQQSVYPGLSGARSD